MNYQNNYVERSGLEYENFLLIMLSFLRNYFDGPPKLFSDLYLAKFLDISAKSFRVTKYCRGVKFFWDVSLEAFEKFLRAKAKLNYSYRTDCSTRRPG